MQKSKKISVFLISVTLILFVVFAIIFFVPIIHKEVILQGSINGFNIGMSKSSAYTQVQDLYKANEIDIFRTISEIEKEKENYPELWMGNEWQSIDEAHDIFMQLDMWMVQSELTEGLSFILRFKNNLLSEFKAGIHYEGILPQDIVPGQSYSDVYSKLVKFFTLNKDKNFLIRSGWTARRQVVEFTDEEYQWIARDRTFYIGLNRWIGHHSLKLYFDKNDSLVKIVKRFQLTETYL